MNVLIYNLMSNIVNNFNLGEIIIDELYDVSATQSDINATPYFYNVDDEYIISFIQLERVKKFNSFEFETIGTLQTRFLEPTYRISRNGSTWTEFLPFDEINSYQTTLATNSTTYTVTKAEFNMDNFPPFDPLDKMWIDLKWKRSGTKTDGFIRLLSYELNGDLLRDENTDTVIVGSGGSSIIKPPYIYKVFRIDDIEIISSSDLTDVSIKYRFSQDNSRTWSEWEPLTKENISTKRINPIRFFQIEYLIENNSSGNIKIQDINLIGDFQNVTLDSQKTNLFGIRECCQSFLVANSANTSNAGSVDENGNFIPNTTGVLSGQSCADNIFNPMTDDEKSKLYNPYQQTQANNLLNKLSNDAMEVFGHRVQYFVTDPDSKGIDYSLHEYGLFTIACEGELKVAVDNNLFPDNQIIMNQFDLNLFDSFEIHITKESFKSLFGVERRPSKEDLVYFCDINRLFIVDHAQQFRNFNNYAIYYKVVLKKYNKSANVQAGEQSIRDRVNQLTNNSTIDQLFNIENKKDKSAVANKDQQQPLTRDPIRVELDNGILINTLIIKELVENSTTIISKQHYDFSEVLGMDPIVKYKNVNSVLKVSDNIGFYAWFNLKNYLEGEEHNFFNFYDDANSLGWKTTLVSDSIVTTLNSDSYTWSFNGSSGDIALSEDVWYCYVINIDQRQRKMSQYIYKRNVEDDEEDRARLLNSTILKPVYSLVNQDITPIEYELDSTILAHIENSDMKLTNIRLFSDIIPETEHNKLLNQYIIADDSKYLIFADNASMKLNLPNFKDNGNSYDRT
jgi:hypothetical protein